MGKSLKERSYQSVLYERIGIRPIAYNVAFKRALGTINAALLMSQLLYWQGVARDMGKQFFYKTVKELEEETGLSRKEQERAVKICIEKGVLKLWKHGVPPKRHFQVKILELKELCLGNKPMERIDGTLEAKQIVPNVPINTETTPDTNPDILKLYKLRKLKKELLGKVI